MNDFESQQFKDELAKTIRQAPKEERKGILNKEREEIEKPESQKLEEKLSPENRALVRRYIENCNEDLYAILLLKAFDESEGKPLNNAFYLHELEELETFRRKGHDFINVNPTEEFRKARAKIYDEDKEPHLTATLSHCKYLQSKARELGIELSLSTIIEYDPISSRTDKDALFEKDKTLEVKEEEKGKALQFFTSLAQGEKGIFLQAFSMGNSQMYAEAIFQPKKEDYSSHTMK